MCIRDSWNGKPWGGPQDFWPKCGKTQGNCKISFLGASCPFPQLAFRKYLPAKVWAVSRSISGNVSRRSRRHPSRASPRLPPGVVSAALCKLPQASSGSSCRHPLRHFSSQLVCATSLASRSSGSSLRSLRRASPRLSPRSRRAIVGPRRFLQDFGRCRKDRGEIEDNRRQIWFFTLFEMICAKHALRLHLNSFPPRCKDALS